MQELKDFESSVLTDETLISDTEYIQNEISKMRTFLEYSFYDFCAYIFKYVYRKELIQNFHQISIAKALERVHSGEIKRLLINIPPRHGKTEFVVILFIAWCFAKRKGCNFLHTSYSDKKALDNSKKIRDIINDQEFKRLWNIEIDPSVSSKSRWSIVRGGGLYAASSGGSITGEGAGTVERGNEFGGALIIDDPHKADSEKSDLQRDNVIENFENVLSSRLNSPNKTPVIVIMQRLHELDLSGHLLSGKSSLGAFDHIVIPAIMDREKNEYDQRERGEALWPFRANIKDLLQIKKTRPNLFSGQQQQNPAPASGLMVEKDFLNFYDFRPPNFDYFYHVIDMNLKENAHSNACHSCYGINPPNIYLVGQQVGKWKFTKAVDIIVNFINLMGSYHGIIVEARASGDALIAELEKKGFHSVIGVTPHKEKYYRMNEVLEVYRAGNVWYPKQENEPWVAAHIHEVLTFPKGKNDDRVDCETMIIKYYRDQFQGGGDYSRVAHI